MDWFDLHSVQVTLKSLLQHHSSKASVLQCSAFFIVQLSHPYMTTGKAIALTRWTFAGKVMSLLFNMLSAKSLQSCPTLCDHIDSSPLGSSVPGILQARILEWIAISFSNVWKWKVKVKSLSRTRLLETPWAGAYQAPPPMGFSRKEYWSGVPLPSPNMLSRLVITFSRKPYTSLLAIPKHLTVWITTNCGEFLKRWEYQTTLPASWEICVQVNKQQLEPDMEQQACSKLGKEYVKAVHCQPDF